MADEESNHHRSIHPPSSPHPLGMSHQSALEHGGCGEIVEVEGGHIVRSTGKKDRHSKVCTAKGPRDRRVRLSAPTAIQFYDVQDRLGFDRPSKAVDWLIKKAKSAIDGLAELPPWNPADAIRQAAANKPKRSKTVIPPPPATGVHGGSGEETEHHHHQGRFLPASPHYHQPPSSRATAQSQDLRLSLHSFQNGPPFADETEHALFSGQSNPLVFDSSTGSWDQSQQNHRLVTWNNGGAADSAASGGGGFVFASPATTTSFQTGYGQSQLFSQRGPLQSINTPMLRAWFDPYHHHHHQSITTNDHHHHHHNHNPYQSAIPGIAFASSGELSGLRVPARYESEQDDHGDKPSSASSDSRH